MDRYSEVLPSTRRRPASVSSPGTSVGGCQAAVDVSLRGEAGATTLAPGNYSANVCVNNNDLAHQRFAVPVSLTVE